MKYRMIGTALAVALAATSGGAVVSATTPSTGTTEPAEPTAGVAGCGEGAFTDPADLSPDRAVARCEPGAPAAVPLAEPVTITVSSGFNAEFVAPLLLAIELGEFEKENLTVEMVSLGFADALPQMATGDIDAAIGGAEAGWFNAVSQGIDARWIFGNYIPGDPGDLTVPQTGLWVRRDVFSDPENPDLGELEGRSVASAVGLGSVIAYPIAEAFAPSGLSLTDIDIQQVPSPEMVTALENGAVDAAWLLDPYWIGAAQDESLMLVATQPPSEVLGGIFAAPTLWQDQPDVAEAFVRAMIRTINTYLDGDYQADPDVMEALSTVTDTSVEDLSLTPSLVFDWEIREGTTDRTQEYFIQFETLAVEAPLPESDVVDRSFYLQAVGAPAP